MRHRADDNPEDEARAERLRRDSEVERVEAQHAAEAIAQIGERWGKRLLIAASVAGLIAGVGLAFGWQLQSPSASTTEFRTTVQAQIDTVGVRIDSLGLRSDTLESSVTELTRYIRFLVAAKCLELDEQSKRDLVISGISCGRISR